MKRHKDQFGCIGVLMGGVSSERAISLKSGQAIVEALNRLNCHVVALDIINDAQDKIRAELENANIDLAFIALHGKLGEDGAIQSILDDMHIPYTGSGVKASQLAYKKDDTQNLLKKNSINIPSYVTLSKGDQIDPHTIVSNVGGFPFIVKPASEGSSIGISLVHGKSKIIEALKCAWQFDHTVLIEQYIKGKELTVGILDQQALPVVEISPQHELFTYEAKYTPGITEYIVPAKISKESSLELQQIALKVHHLLGCEDLSRVDFMLDTEGEPFVIEINTIPGFTATSLLPKAAGEVGLNFDKLVLRLLELAHGKKKEIKNTSVH